jgi:hypothetical protein
MIFTQTKLKNLSGEILNESVAQTQIPTGLKNKTEPSLKLIRVMFFEDYPQKLSEILGLGL